MLNRTNRTLSAHLNRLNLGTRSFAQLANANIGNETLRHAHAASPVAVRAGDARYPRIAATGGSSIMGTKPGAAATSMAKRSGSSPMPQWSQQDQATWAQVMLVADASVVVRPVHDPVVVPPGRGVAPPESSPSRLARLALASCRLGMVLAGRSARDAVVSDAAP